VQAQAQVQFFLPAAAAGADGQQTYSACTASSAVLCWGISRSSSSVHNSCNLMARCAPALVQAAVSLLERASRLLLAVRSDGTVRVTLQLGNLRCMLA
jgi:hypothetical protein